MNVLAELRNRFSSVLSGMTPDPAPFVAMVKPTQDGNFGDFQANCAMPLRKVLCKEPRAIATEIVTKLVVTDLCQPPEVAGPGFINIRLRDDWLAEQINRNVTDSRLGVEPVARPMRIVIDYSAPNVAKPMHVGHLRSTVLGNALYRVATFLGHRVLGDNHIGDWGTQFGMILFGYKNFLDRAAFDQNPVGELARQYRLVNQLSGYHEAKTELPKAESRQAELQTELKSSEANKPTNDKQAEKSLKKLRTDVTEVRDQIASFRKQIEAVESSPPLKALADAQPQIAEHARRETAKLHAGDEENTRLWNQFVPQCLQAIQGLYDRLDIRFDMSRGESYYNPKLAGVVEDLQAKGLATESDGAICVFIPGNAAPFIIRKRDGAFTYATSDLATIRDRIEELNAETMLYVVDTRQSEHFRLLFEIAKLWGNVGCELVHVNFGTILGKDGKPYKTRSGDTVGLESLLDAAVAKARQIVNENDDAKKDEAGNPTSELDEAERAAVAETVGIGAIKYADLRHNRESDYVYDEDKMLATNGDTATYMQYAYARVAGIFRKGGIDRETLRSGGGRIVFTHPSERALALQLLRFSEALDGVLAENRPNILTDYLFATAQAFSTFFQDCHVLRAADEAIRTSRLLLCDLTARVIATGLDLLGIKTCEQM
ncbi:MAG: arginine--tRNA ligase [Planctomycetaceae bacterium]|nr:arginine--tRNA ligase [Planctomycetaceae bacterium]